PHIRHTRLRKSPYGFMIWNTPGKLLQRGSTNSLLPSPQETRVMLIQLRRDLGLSRSKLAFALHCSTNALRSWEQGSRKPSSPVRMLIFVVDKLLRLDPDLGWIRWGYCQCAKRNGLAEDDWSI